MGRIDDIENPSVSPISSRYSPSSGRYNDMREGGDYYRSYPRSNYGSQYESVLSDVETVSNPETSVQTEHWFTNHWRPAMAWLYFCIVGFDFIAAPIFTFWFAFLTHTPYVQWHPISLEGGGIIHVSLGAIIGVYTWSRTREKLANLSTYNNRRY